MPVTSRKLLVYKVSGQGKKAPTNLKYDHLKKQLINIACFCKPVVECCTDDTRLDGGLATSNFVEVVYDDGTGIPFDGGDAQTEICS
jgi:hypothetical protein